MERIAAMPGVQSVGLVNELPLDEGADMGRFSTEPMEASGSEAPLVAYSQTARSRSCLSRR